MSTFFLFRPICNALSEEVLVHQKCSNHKLVKHKLVGLQQVSGFGYRKTG